MCFAMQLLIVDTDVRVSYKMCCKRGGAYSDEKLGDELVVILYDSRGGKNNSKEASSS